MIRCPQYMVEPQLIEGCPQTEVDEYPLPNSCATNKILISKDSINILNRELIIKNADSGNHQKMAELQINMWYRYSGQVILVSIYA